MTDFSKSVIMPREDFIELSQVAFDNSHVPSIGERTGQVLQTTLILGAVAGAVTLATWGYVKAHDWYDERSHRRAHAAAPFAKKTSA